MAAAAPLRRRDWLLVQRALTKPGRSRGFTRLIGPGAALARCVSWVGAEHVRLGFALWNVPLEVGPGDVGPPGVEEAARAWRRPAERRARGLGSVLLLSPGPSLGAQFGAGNEARLWPWVGGASVKDGVASLTRTQAGEGGCTRCDAGPGPQTEGRSAGCVVRVGTLPGCPARGRLRGQADAAVLAAFPGAQARPGACVASAARAGKGSPARTHLAGRARRTHGARGACEGSLQPGPGTTALPLPPHTPPGGRGSRRRLISLATASSVSLATSSDRQNETRQRRRSGAPGRLVSNGGGREFCSELCPLGRPRPSRGWQALLPPVAFSPEPLGFVLVAVISLELGQPAWQN